MTLDAAISMRKPSKLRKLSVMYLIISNGTARQELKAREKDQKNSIPTKE
jgi:hypothetical protein